jgi:hypothetical protein
MSQFFGLKSGNKLDEEIAPKTETRRFSQFLRKSLKLEKETEILSTGTQPGSRQSSEIDSFQQLQLLIQQEDEQKNIVLTTPTDTKLQKKTSSKNTKSPRNDPTARKSLSLVHSFFKKQSPRNEFTNPSGSLTPEPQLKNTITREFHNEETFKIKFEEKKDKRKSFISSLFSKK